MNASRCARFGLDADRAGRRRTQLIAELTELQGEYDRSIRDLNELQQANSDGAGDDQGRRRQQDLRA